MAYRRNQPTEPIGTLADDVGRHFVRLHCKKCAHTAQFDPADFANRYGVDLPMAHLARNAVCTQCGHRGASLTISAPSTPTVQPQPTGWCRLSDRGAYMPRNRTAQGSAPSAPETASTKYFHALKRIAVTVAGEEKARLWLDSRSRSLRAKPSTECLDEPSFHRCVDALEADLRIKVTKRDRHPFGAM